MKYNLTESIINFIKRKETESNNKIIFFDEESLLNVRKVLDKISGCHYPELDGLRVYGNIKIEEDIAFIPLINRFGEFLNMKLTSKGTFLLLGPNDYLLQVNASKGSAERYSTSFYSENDYVMVNEEKNLDIVFKLYTNVINASGVKTQLSKLIPDYKITLRYYYDGTSYYRNSSFSSTIYVNSDEGLTLDQRRELTKLFIDYCYSQMDKLELNLKSK